MSPDARNELPTRLLPNRGGAPGSKVELLFEWSVRGLLAVAALAVLLAVTRDLRRAGPAPALPRDDGSTRFGLDEAKRRAVFADIASHEPSNIALGQAGFPGQPWSQEDHRCAMERGTQADVARRFGLTMTQVYLILDEGIRKHWPGVDGQPLNPRSVPLQPRKKQ